MKTLATLVVLITLGLLAPPAQAEYTPPGEYFDYGLVVKRANGSYDLFFGWGCLLTLPDKLARTLEPYVGKQIRLDYTRVKAEDSVVYDRTGSPIGKFNKITVLPPPTLEVTLTLSKTSYSLAEPIAGTVTVRRLGSPDEKIDVKRVEINLLKDYRGKHRLFQREVFKRTGPDLAVVQALPAGQVPKKKKEEAASDAAATSVTVHLQSDHMARPGEFEAVAMIRKDQRPVFSKPVRVVVRPAKDREEENAALRAWSTRAAPRDRVRMVEKLIARGDRSAVEGLVEYFEKRKDTYGVYAGYRFLWQHGGARGEKLMLAELKRSWNQASARSVMEGVHLSPRRLTHLRAWLSDKRELFKDISGWCEKPRVCDITAGWLCGYTKGALKFPKAGTVAERDKMVAVVLERLAADPTQFSVLAADYR